MAKKTKRILRQIPLPLEDTLTHIGYIPRRIPEGYKPIGRPDTVAMGRGNRPDRGALLISAPREATHYVLGRFPTSKGYIIQYYIKGKKNSLS